MSRNTTLLMILWGAFLLSSCESISVKVFSRKVQISGKVSALTGKISTNQAHQAIALKNLNGACSEDVVASLYQVSANGEIDRSHPLASTKVGENAVYKFNLPEKIVNNKNNFQVEVTGCEEGYFEKRLITHFDNNQNIFQESTFVTDILNNSLYNANFLGIDKLKKLIIQLDNEQKTSLEKEQIILSFLGESKEEALKKIKPEVFFSFSGTIARENEAKLIKTYLHHPDPNFNANYSWKVDGVFYSSDKNFTYIPTKNSSGQRNVELEITTNYSTGLDIKSSLKFQVLNNFPIESPDFAIRSDLLVNNYILTKNLMIEIEHFENCDTYSAFVITDTDLVPPPSSFVYDCTDTLLTFNLINDQNGQNSLYLWAKDNEGNIQKSLIHYYVDKVLPEANLILSKNKIKGGNQIVLSAAFSDNESGVKEAKLTYSENNFNSEVILASNLAGSGSVNWTAPSLNSIVHFKLKITDNVNNVYESVAQLIIDSEPPTAPVLTLLSSNNTKEALIQTQLSGCVTSNSYLILVTKSTLAPSTPSVGHADWKSCSDTVIQSSFLASGDGTNAIYAWLKDDVGNISLISNKITAYIDQTPPHFLKAPTIGEGVKPGSEHEISWLVYDVTQPVKMSYRLCDALGCEAYLVSNVQESLITANEKKITAPAVEKTELYLEYTAIDALGNITKGKSYFNVDFTPPIIASIVVNQNNKFATTSVVPLLIDINDGDNSLGMKIHIDTIEMLNEGDYASTACPNSVAVGATWYEWKNAEEAILLALDMKEGPKKLCVFAKDGADNVSLPSDALVVYEKKNPPSIKEFYVYKTNSSNPLDKTLYNYNSGDIVNIEWAIYDVEGFGSQDVALSYSLDGLNWLDVVSKKEINDSANITWLSSNTLNQNNRQGAYTQFKAPSCLNNPNNNCQQFFRVKIFAKDRSETFSLPVLSAPQNTGRWSVFAGTEDRGINGQALGASLRMSGNLFQNLIKVDQKTGNLYLQDITYGLRKYNVKTGIISSLFDIDLNEELKTQGSFITSFRAKVNSVMNVLPLNDDQLLLFLRDYEGLESYLYFVDYRTKTYRRILGGGTGRDLSSPFNFAIYPQVLEKDENGLIYLMQPCDMSVFEVNSGNTEIIRVKMNEDFTFSQRESVVGNCDSNTFNYSLGMNSEDFVYKHQYVNFGEFKVINANYFYLGVYGKPYYKIVNKKVYASAMVSPSYPNLAYDKLNNIIYTKNATQGIKRYKINPLNGTANEVDQDSGEYVKSLATGYLGNCNAEGVHKDSACILAMDMATGSNGQLYFVDGTKLNSNSNYILKTINQDNVLKNVAGSLSFYGDGLNKSLIRGRIGGIHYNQEAFGSVSKGLYLVSPDMVFGRIGEDDIYHTLFGNQIALDMNIGSNVAITPQLTMGAPYSGGEGFSLAFDNENIYLRLMTKFGRIDKDLKFSFMQNYSTATNWDILGENTDIRTANLSPYGTFQNLLVKENKFILAGAYVVFNNATYDNRVTQISLFDFNTNLKTYIMGYGSTFVQRKNFSNFLSADSVRNTPYSYNCIVNNCILYYEKNSDRLYILGREDGIIRYVTNPYLTNGVTPTKGVIPNVEMKVKYTFTNTYNANASDITNMTISEDSSQLFYLTETGFYCVPLTPQGEKAWCNNEDLYPYEKELGTFQRGPNSITWKDERTLLISNFTDKILQFVLPN